MIAELSNRHTTNLNARLGDLRWQHGQLQNALDRLSPKHAVNAYRQRLDEVRLRLERSIRVSLDKKALQVDNFAGALRSLNPWAVLNRGYAIVTRESDGRLVKHASQVHPGEGVHIQVSQGKMDATITKITQEEENDA